MLCLKHSSVYFQYVNEQAAHVKIDCDFCRCQPSWAVVPYFSNFPCCGMVFDYWGFINEN